MIILSISHSQNDDNSTLQTPPDSNLLSYHHTYSFPHSGHPHLSPRLLQQFPNGLPVSILALSSAQKHPVVSHTTQNKLQSPHYAYKALYDLAPTSIILISYHFSIHSIYFRHSVLTGSFKVAMQATFHFLLKIHPSCFSLLFCAMTFYSVP